MSSTSRGHADGRPPVDRLNAGSVGQLMAGLGAVLALLSPIWLWFPAAGVVFMLLGVIVSAPEARNSGPYLEQWWTALAASAMVCLAGFVLELLVPVAGGVLLTAGGVAALVVVGLGTPPRAAADRGPPATDPA